MLYEAMRASALEVSHQAISLGQTMKDVMGFINSDDFVAAMTNMKLDTEQRLQAADLHKQTPNLLSFAKK